MTNLEQAARQALEALQLCANGEDNTMLTRDALGALRQALEQPKQEPVAWMTEYGNIMHANTRAKWVEFDGGRGCERFADYVIPLYTAMRQVLEKQPNTMDNLNMPLSDFLRLLTVRPANSIRSECGTDEALTVRDLLLLGRHKLLRLPNFGSKSMKELEQALSSLDLLQFFTTRDDKTIALLRGGKQSEST